MKQKSWDKKIAKRKNEMGSNLTQSLLKHTLKALDLFFTLLPHLREIRGWSDNEEQVLILGITSHDAGKTKDSWQAYIQGEGAPTSHIDTILIEECIHELAQELNFTNTEVAQLAAELHMKRAQTNERMLSAILNTTDSNWKELQQIVYDIDNLASTDHLFSAQETFQRSILDQYFHSTYYQIQVKGISSTLLHRAILEEFQSVNWIPMIYFGNGTFLIQKASQEKRIPAFDQIQKRLKDIIKNQVFMKNQRKLPELVVGNITQNFLPKPELFDSSLLEEFLLTASTRAGIKTSKNITPANAYKYHNVRRLLDVTKDPSIAQKAYVSFKALKDKVPEEYHQYLIFNAEEMDKELEMKYRDQIGSAYPEIAIFKFFKNILHPPKGLVSENDLEQIKTLYEEVFGEKSFEALKSTSTLMPAKDKAFTVDYFWALPGDRYEFNVSKIGRLSPDRRKRLLIKILTDLGERIFNSLESAFSQENLVSGMSDAFIRDLSMEFTDGEIIKKFAKEQLKNYKNSKDNSNRDKETEHICPICNEYFSKGAVGYADFLDKPQSFSNRGYAYCNTGNNVVICKSCYYERLLRQIFLGAKPFELFVLIPEDSLSPYAGECLLNKAENLESKFSKIMSPVCANPDLRFHMNNTYHLARELARLDVEKLQSEEMVNIFTYQLNSDTANTKIKKLQTELEDYFESDLEEINDTCEKTYLDWSEFAKDVYYNQVDLPLYDDILMDLRKRVCKLNEPIKIVSQTPNFILMPAWNPYVPEISPIAGDKSESDTNIGLKKLFVSCIFALGLDCAVTIIEDKSILEPAIFQNHGRVKVPDIPLVKKIIPAQWLSEEETKKWLKALTAAFVLVNRTGFSERDNIYKILTIGSIGKLIRRIEQKGNSIHYRDLKFIEDLKEVM